MIVDRINIPVCKPCPRCGMPQIMQYDLKDSIRVSITCYNRCYFIGHNCKSVDDAIEAWNILVAGKEPEIVRLVDVPVVYNKRSYDVKTIGAEVSVPYSALYKAGIRGRANILDEAKTMCYHKIADKLMEERIGTALTTEDHEREAIVTRLTVGVVDKSDRRDEWSIYE